MQQIELDVRIEPMARRVITTNGGTISPGGTNSSIKRVTFSAIKVWQYATNTDHLVGWNVLTHYKSKNILRCRHPKLLTVRQLDEIDTFILPRLRDARGQEMDPGSNAGPS